MAFAFKQIEAHDPNNPGLVAPNASVTIFEPGDPAKTPLTLTKLTGEPLANPVTVNGLGYGPAFMHATLPQVAWSGGGLTGTFESYEGMRDEAIGARVAAENVVTQAASGAFNGAPGADGANGINGLDGAPGAKGDRGEQGLPGVNAVENDTAVAAYVNSSASATKAALENNFASLSEMAPNWDKNTRYEAGQLFVKAGRIRRVTVGHNSGGTYSDTNSVDVGPMIVKPRSIVLRGKADGGDVYDSTSHLIIESYQRPQGGSFGESLRLHNMLPKSKSMISWWGALDPSLPANEDTNPIWPMAWIGAHYGAQDDGDPIHGHISIEVPDESLSLRTRWGINYVDRDTLMPGVAKATVYSNSADVLVNTSGTQALILAAYPGNPDGSSNSDRTIKVASVSASEDTIQGVATSSYRWSFGGTAVPETGANNGTDFMFQPLSDVGGETLPIALFLRRKTGRAIFGGATTKPARVSAVWDGATDNTVHGFYAEPTALTAGYAAFAALLPTAGDSFIRQRAVGDTVDRLDVNGAGKITWGSGAATRDTALYRNAVNELKTDGAFVAGGLVTSVGLTSTGTQRFGTGATVGSGVGVIGIGNAITAPTTNPGSGVILYAEDGKAKFRQNDGSIINFTPLAAIASPTADVASLKTAVDALRIAIRDLGKTA